MNNIFDLNNLEDLTQEIKSQLVIQKVDPAYKKIISLLEKAGKPLNLDEMMVGYYREYGVLKPRKYFMSKLYNMSRSRFKQIESVKGKKGTYALTITKETDK